MKKIIQSLSLVALVCVMAVSTASAQKLAYTNSVALLSEMPEVKRADANLEILRKQLLKKKETMVTEYQNKLKVAVEKEQNGTLSQQEAEAFQKQLSAKEKAIYDYDQTVQKQLMDKREQEVGPILKKVQAAIDAVAKEKGYDFVLDSSTGSLLFANQKMDITAAVKARLGIK
jgi:outer membrane protein